MGRRHDALIPLTHDHHHALHQARLLRQAADGEIEARKDAAQGFIEFFRTHSVPHFRQEEEEIFPLVALRVEAPAESIKRILTEHVRIHALVARLASQTEAGDPAAVTMREVADLLRAHIRFEEDELFPAIERIVPDELYRMVSDSGR